MTKNGNADQSEWQLIKTIYEGKEPLFDILESNGIYQAQLAKGTVVLNSHIPFIFSTMNQFGKDLKDKILLMIDFTNVISIEAKALRFLTQIGSARINQDDLPYIGAVTPIVPPQLLSNQYRA